MSKNDTPPKGKMTTENYASLPIDLLLAPGVGVAFSLKARIVTLLSGQRSKKAGTVELTYRQIAEILGASCDSVSARCRELVAADSPVVERTKNGVRFRWQGLAKTLPGMDAYRKLTWKTKGHNTKPLREYLEGNEGRALEQLTCRLTNAEFEFLSDRQAFDDLSFWSRDLPGLLREQGITAQWERYPERAGMIATDAAVCWAVAAVFRCALKMSVDTPAALLRAMLKNRAKYQEFFTGIDGAQRIGLPTLSERLQAGGLGTGEFASEMDDDEGAVVTGEDDEGAVPTEKNDDGEAAVVELLDIDALLADRGIAVSVEEAPADDTSPVEGSAFDEFVKPRPPRVPLLVAAPAAPAALALVKPERCTRYDATGLAAFTYATNVDQREPPRDEDDLPPEGRAILEAQRARKAAASNAPADSAQVASSELQEDVTQDDHEDDEGKDHEDDEGKDHDDDDDDDDGAYR